MRRIALPFLLFSLLLVLALPSLAALRAAPEGATRITEGAALAALEGWPDSGQIVARDGAGWLAISLGDGARAAIAPRTTAESALTIESGGDGHALLLDGRELWRTESEILTQATLSPDGGWLVAVRTPRGSETAALGELWRLDIASGEWRALTANGTAEGFPLISPVGERVAFLRDGDLWTIPATRTTREALADPAPSAAGAAERLLSHTPPATIRVKHVTEGVSNPNNCRPGVPHGREDHLHRRAQPDHHGRHHQPASGALKAPRPGLGERHARPGLAALRRQR